MYPWYPPPGRFESTLVLDLLGHRGGFPEGTELEITELELEWVVEQRPLLFRSLKLGVRYTVEAKTTDHQDASLWAPLIDDALLVFPSASGFVVMSARSFAGGPVKAAQLRLRTRLVVLLQGEEEEGEERPLEASEVDKLLADGENGIGDGAMRSLFGISDVRIGGHALPISCELGPWSEFGMCDGKGDACPGSSQRRGRPVLRNEHFGGELCLAAEREDERICDAEACWSCFNGEHDAGPSAP